MMMRQQVTLLDELTRRMGCAYLSDLHRQLGSAQFQDCVTGIEPGEYALDQCQDAVDYLLPRQVSTCPDAGGNVAPNGGTSAARKFCARERVPRRNDKRRGPRCFWRLASLGRTGLPSPPIFAGASLSAGWVSPPYSTDVRSPAFFISSKASPKNE